MRYGVVCCVCLSVAFINPSITGIKLYSYVHSSKGTYACKVTEGFRTVGDFWTLPQLLLSRSSFCQQLHSVGKFEGRVCLRTYHNSEELLTERM